MEARGFSLETDPLLQNPDGQKGGLRLEPSSTSDKRDDVLPARYVLAGVPFVTLRLGPSCLWRVPGGVVFRKLSKLPNTENA